MVCDELHMHAHSGSRQTEPAVPCEPETTSWDIIVSVCCSWAVMSHQICRHLHTVWSTSTSADVNLNACFWFMGGRPGASVCVYVCDWFSICCGVMMRMAMMMCCVCSLCSTRPGWRPWGWTWPLSAVSEFADSFKVHNSPPHPSHYKPVCPILLLCGCFCLFQYKSAIL